MLSTLYVEQAFTRTVSTANTPPSRMLRARLVCCFDLLYLNSSSNSIIRSLDEYYLAQLLQRLLHQKKRYIDFCSVTSSLKSDTSHLQLSIYPEPEPQLVLIDTPTELERQIGHARETVTGAYRDSYAYVQGWVSKWIGIEHAVERELLAFDTTR